MPNKVVRIHPEGKTALINYIEENFEDIEEFIFTSKHKDNTTMTIYDCYSYFDACAINNIQNDTIHEIAHNDYFVAKER